MDPNPSFTLGADPGSAFVASQGYKAIRDSSARGQTWTTGLIDVGSVTLDAKGTLLEGSGSPGSGTGGGWLRFLRSPRASSRRCFSR
jgi:hypothetical protein